MENFALYQKKKRVPKSYPKEYTSVSGGNVRRSAVGNTSGATQSPFIRDDVSLMNSTDCSEEQPMLVPLWSSPLMCSLLLRSSPYLWGAC